MALEDDLRRYLHERPGAPADAILATRLVMRAAAQLRTRMDAALAPDGLHMRDYLALAIIHLHRGASLRPSDLSVSLDATRTQITRLLDALARQGLVERLPATDDRRALELALTPAGEAKLAECAPRVHAAYREAWAGVAPLAPVLQGLRALNARLHQSADADADASASRSCGSSAGHGTDGD